MQGYPEILFAIPGPCGSMTLVDGFQLIGTLTGTAPGPQESVVYDYLPVGLISGKEFTLGSFIGIFRETLRHAARIANWIRDRCHDKARFVWDDAVHQACPGV